MHSYLGALFYYVYSCLLICFFIFSGVEWDGKDLCAHNVSSTRAVKTEHATSLGSATVWRAGADSFAIKVYHCFSSFLQNLKVFKTVP